MMKKDKLKLNINTIMVHYFKMKFVFLLLFLGINDGLIAQNHSSYQSYVQKYPEANLLNLKHSEKINVKISNNKLRIESDTHLENLYLTNKASLGGQANQSIGYSSYFQEIGDIEAYTMVPQKDSYKKIKVKEFSTEHDQSGGIFYDDYMKKKFSFLGIQEGAITVLKYQEVQKNPYMMPSFSFGNYIPAENAEFSVTFPSNVSLKFKQYGDFSNIIFEETKSKNKTTYTWTSNKLKLIKYEDDAPSINHVIPSVHLLIENYTIDDVKNEILGDEKKLFKYYESLVRPLNKEVSAELKKTTDSLTNGKSDLDKVKAIYYWVQDHVKYVAFEDGMGGFIPRESTKVFEKRYGDCKDMASILTSMMSIANVKNAYLGWIGTRLIPYKYAENPTLKVDNHMIAVVKVKGEYQFLDATDDHLDYGLPSNHIQGKECMIKLDSLNFKILNVPSVKSSLNTKKDSIYIQLKDNKVLGKSTSYVDGLWKTQFLHSLSSISEKEKQEYAEHIFKVGNNKCKIDKTEFLNLNKREKPLIFNYNFQIADYTNKIEEELFFNPHLNKHLSANNLIKNDRENDFEFDFAWLENYVMLLEIPNNYEISYLPKSRKFEYQDFDFTIDYKIEKGKIIINQTTQVKSILLKKENFIKWNELIKKMTEIHSESIGFKLISKK